MMGFTGFGKPQKAARKFDLDAIFEKTKREARTILSHNGMKMFSVCAHECLYVCVCVCAYVRACAHTYKCVHVWMLCS